MNHRERRNFRGKKTRTEPLDHPIHGQTSMFNSMNCLILKVRGIHALKPFPSVPAALDQGHAWSKMKKKILPRSPTLGHDRTIQWELRQEGDRNNSSLSPSSAAIPSESAMGPLLGVVSSPWLWEGSWGWAGWAIDILDTGRFLVDSSPSLQQGMNVPQ